MSHIRASRRARKGQITVVQMVERPEDYRWSSYRANASGERDPVVVPHPEYLSLGATARKRKAAYRKLFNAELDSEAIGDVRACLQSGTPLGNDRFRSQIERALGVKVGYRRRGRPKKVAEKPVTGGDQKIVGLFKGI